MPAARKSQVPAYAKKLKGRAKAKDEQGYFTGVLVPKNPGMTHRGARGTNEEINTRKKQVKRKKKSK